MRCKPFANHANTFGVNRKAQLGLHRLGPRRGARTRTRTRTRTRHKTADKRSIPGGCGKSTVVEPFEKIFVSLEKPQVGSTFILGDLDKVDVILWQDYEHDEKMLRISDLCSLLAGESVGIRKPGKTNTKHRNTAPCIYTGRAAISCQRTDKRAERMYNGMIAERFRIFEFVKPLPMADRDVDFPQCARCCACMFASYAPRPSEETNLRTTMRVVALEQSAPQGPGFLQEFGVPSPRWARPRCNLIPKAWASAAAIHDTAAAAPASSSSPGTGPALPIARHSRSRKVRS